MLRPEGGEPWGLSAPPRGGRALGTKCSAHHEPPFLFSVPPPFCTTEGSLCRGERERYILDATEALLPRARSCAQFFFAGYVTCALHKVDSNTSKMADVKIEKTSPEKMLEAGDNFDMPPPCIPSTPREGENRQ